MLFGMSLFAFKGHAQLLQLIGSSGGTGQSGGTGITWTMGEPVVASMLAGNLMLTTGLLQPVLVANAISNVNGLPFSVQAYPNPAHGFLEIQLYNTSFQDFNYVLFDTGGRLLHLTKPSDALTRIDLEHFPAGLYFLKVLQAGKEVTTFEIVKQ